MEIYSRNFLLKTRSLDICQCKSNILKNVDLSVSVDRLPPPFIPNENRRRSNNWRDNRVNDVRVRFEREQSERLVRGANAWVPDTKPKTDIKKIRGILNKLSETNKDTLLKETQNIEYTDPEVVSIIFKKAVSEPFFSELYAHFCLGLTKLHSLIRGLCTEEFGKIRDKNLCRFVGELYKLKLIEDLQSFVNLLKEDLDDTNIEILCELINTVDPKDPQFSQIIDELYDKRSDYSARFKFMIMDVYDYKSGKRKPKQKKAETELS